MVVAHQSFNRFEIGVLQPLHTQSVLVVTAVLSVREEVRLLFVAKWQNQAKNVHEEDRV